MARYTWNSKYEGTTRKSKIKKTPSVKSKVEGYRWEYPKINGILNNISFRSRIQPEFRTDIKELAMISTCKTENNF